MHSFDRSRRFNGHNGGGGGQGVKAAAPIGAQPRTPSQPRVAEGPELVNQTLDDLLDRASRVAGVIGEKKLSAELARRARAVREATNAAASQSIGVAGLLIKIGQVRR